jgi:hypothetical protein
VNNGNNVNEQNQEKGMNAMGKYSSLIFVNFYLFFLDIVPYSSNETCCYMCKEKLKVEKDCGYDSNAISR